MAEGWLGYYGKGAAEVVSAGFNPDKLDMKAASSMMDAVIDITRYRSKGMSEVSDKEFDFVICLDKELESIIPEFKGNPSVVKLDYPNLYEQNFEEDEGKKVYNNLRDDLENMAFDFIHEFVKPLY
jgi:protein-tyrosine-phosphatase